MNTIFFGQNVPIQSAAKVKIDYINKTKLPIRVSIRWRDRDVQSYTTETLTLIAAGIAEQTVALEEFESTSGKGLIVEPITNAIIQSSTTYPDLFVKATVKEVETGDTNTIGTFNKGGAINPIIATKEYRATVTFEYNSGIYINSTAASHVPSVTSNRPTITVFSDADSYGITGIFTQDTAVTYADIEGDSYTHYIKVNNCKNIALDRYISGTSSGSNSSISYSDLYPTNIGTIDIGKTLFLWVRSFTYEKESTPTPDPSISCDVYVCSRNNLNNTECSIDIYEGYGTTGVRLANLTLAPGEENWVSYEGGYRTYSSIRLNSILKGTQITITLNGSQVSDWVNKTTKYVWIN
mgnify:FL=1